MTTPVDIDNLPDRLREECSAVIKERDDLKLQLSSLQEKVKTKLAWHRDGIGPDVPVLQERYDNLIKERDELRAERTRLREVLRLFSVRNTQSGPCWCSGDPRVFDHSQRCLQARALLNDQKEQSE